MLHYPLLKSFDHDSRLSWRDGRGISAVQFLAMATDLAARLPNRTHVVNVCQDRYNFVVGFAAALLAGQISLLPNSRAAKALREMARRYPDAYYLADHKDTPSDVPRLNFPSGLDRSNHRTIIPMIPADRIAAIVFTSGSTGTPVPHAKTWESLVAGAAALAWKFGMPPASSRTVVGTVPPQHMYGLETTVMFPLQWGWTAAARAPVFPKDLQLDLETLPNPAWLMTTPLHLRACIDQRVMLPNLEGIISATMPLLPKLAQRAERMWGVPVYEIYGCTEGGMIASRRTTVESTWTVCQGLRMWQEGDSAWVAGGHVGGPLRLGDRISVTTEHEFVLHGRTTDLIKVAGRRASLEALNAELTQISGVLDGMFYMPEPSDTGNERLAAFAVAPGRSVRGILTDLRKRIDPVFLPRPLRLVDALPRNSSGKLPRESLRALVALHCGAPQ